MNTHLRWWIVIAVVTVLAILAVTMKPFKPGLDLRGGIRVVLEAKVDQLPPDKLKTWGPESMNSVVQIVDRRVNGLGVTEPVIQAQLQKNRVVVELPGVADEAEALRIIQTTAQLEFRYLPSVMSDRNTNARYEIQTQTDRNGNEVHVVWDRIANKEVDIATFLKEQSELVVTGADLLPKSKPDFGQNGAPIVEFELNREGTRRFGEFTRRHIGEILAIVLDGRIISAPRVNSAILQGKGIIEGGFTSIKEAADLSNLLNSGSLPVPLEIIQTTKIGATLGKEAVHRSLLAGIVGIGLVLLFMLFYYRLPGLIACIALGLYTLYSIGAYKALGVVFTVPGIAAFILSVGMAVDANILIFERLKEELRGGKTLRQAIDDGFKRAFTAIFDSNVCTIITSIILYNLGTGPVKGFALMLMIGVIISMFTAITATRTMLWSLVSTGKVTNLALFGVGKVAWHVNYDFIGRRNIWFTLSGAVILLGIVFMVLFGFRAGIDFAGGSELQLRYTAPVTAQQAQRRLAEIGLKDARAVVGTDGSGHTTVYIRALEIKPTEKDRIKAQMATLAANNPADFEQGFEQVSGTVSSEQTSNALKALIWSWILILLYLTVRFAIGGIKDGFKYGVAAIVAVLHDVFVVAGLFAIMGKLAGWEIDALFVTAMLTMIGFSTHDTIVVFDRIRENLKHRARGETYSEVANKSVNQTIARSINTSLTLVLTLIALMAFGTEVTFLFNMALLVGVITGTYSSIFNAAPLVVVWEKIAGRDTPAKVSATATSAGAPSRDGTEPTVTEPAQSAPRRSRPKKRSR